MIYKMHLCAFFKLCSWIPWSGIVSLSPWKSQWNPDLIRLIANASDTLSSFVLSRYSNILLFQNRKLVTNPRILCKIDTYVHNYLDSIVFIPLDSYSYIKTDLFIHLICRGLLPRSPLISKAECAKKRICLSEIRNFLLPLLLWSLLLFCICTFCCSL